MVLDFNSHSRLPPAQDCIGQGGAWDLSEALVESTALGEKRPELYDDLFETFRRNARALPLQAGLFAQVSGIARQARVVTERGAVKAWRLRAGDRLLTRDNGFQPVVWMRQYRTDQALYADDPHTRPLMIQSNVLECGQPDEPLVVAPGQHVLIGGQKVKAAFGAGEVLVSAWDLIGEAGVCHAQVAKQSYVQVLLPHHELIMVNGAWTESLLPDDANRRSMGPAERAAVEELYPQLCQQPVDDAYPAARIVLRGKQVAALFV